MRHEREFQIVECYDERYPGWIRLLALFSVFLVGFLLWQFVIQLIFA